MAFFFRSQSEATKIRSIFGLRAGISSQRNKITQPNLHAIEVSYLALSYFYSSVTPDVTRSMLNAWFDVSTELNYVPVCCEAWGLKFSIGASELISLCHAIRSFSIYEPNNCR